MMKDNLWRPGRSTARDGRRRLEQRSAAQRRIELGAVPAGRRERVVFCSNIHDPNPKSRTSTST